LPAPPRAPDQLPGPPKHVFGWLLPRPPPTAAARRVIDDLTLIKAFGAAEHPAEPGWDHPRLTAWDRQLQGVAGASLRLLVEQTAKLVGVDPGLLAANALHEVTSGSWYVQKVKSVPNTLVGVDWWHTMQVGVKAVVPAAATIQATPQAGHFVNEKGEDAGPVYLFKDGPNALLAVACTLEYLEVQLEKEVGAAAWARMPIGERFALVRYGYNAGLNGAKALA
jgi:hypothetical protein